MLLNNQFNACEGLSTFCASRHLNLSENARYKEVKINQSRTKLLKPPSPLIWKVKNIEFYTFIK